MKLTDKIKNKLKKNEFTRKLVEHYSFRTIIFTIISLAITLGFAIYYAVLGVWLGSIWFGALASYYIVLASMRAFILHYHNKQHKQKRDVTEQCERVKQAKIYRICGVLLILLPICLSFAILQMVHEKAAFVKTGLMIYVSATYTTYKVVMAIRHFIKSRKENFLTVKAVRNINLADTAVSVLALQTAMFYSFSPEMDYWLFNALTGAAVCLITIIIGALMINKANKTIKQIKQENGQ